MRYAETGYNLEIDLATGNIERVETDPRTMEMHLGGLGQQRQDPLGPRWARSRSRSTPRTC